MTSEALAEGDAQLVSRVCVLGALTLYLDFLNMFLFILSLLGSDDEG
jgi:FtsH-binding integral membrane protein